VAIFAHVAPTLARMRERQTPTRLLRIARPRPTMAFSRRDERMAGFDRAVEAARAAGFAAAVRPVGGTFAPMHDGSLVVDEFGWSPPGEWPTDRFDRHAALLAEVFASYGIDARVGEVPGEYCPGAHSVNRGGLVKLSGSAQRVSSGAWLVSSVVQVGPIDDLLPVTAAVASLLAAPVDVATIGALCDTVPGIAPDDVACRILRRFEADGVDETVLVDAR
jgi:octanoyl-[GcvH]:protein N-octanoyltransferase